MNLNRPYWGTPKLGEHEGELAPVLTGHPA